ncbi:MAG: peroxide stress protein YaaA [Spirochaetales bacterium]|nr:peroxide stress protein YaaA [Spirochaetales bacterium]
MTMRIIISPAKKMRVDSDSLRAEGTPIFNERARELQGLLRSLGRDELRRVWACSEKLFSKAEGLLSYELEDASTPALIAYDGIQYQYMAPKAFSYDELEYVEEHLRIISGFYGILRPLDRVIPYRLEMQSKFPGKGGLYAYWNDDIYKALKDRSNVIINLASEEYAKAVRPYLDRSDTFIDVYFAERECGKLVEKGVYAKIARGEMVRFLSSIKAERAEDMKDFSSSGYSFDPSLSSSDRYVFIR